MSYVVNATQQKKLRPAGPMGEALQVATYSGQKVLVDFFDRDTVVILQFHRRARLKDLPAHLRERFGVSDYASTKTIRLKEVESCNLGFSFDGSERRAVHINELPDGQRVDVLPGVLEISGCVRVPVVPTQPVHFCAVAVVAA